MSGENTFSFIPQKIVKKKNMDSGLILDEKELFLQILSLPDISDEPMNKMDTFLKEFFEENPFPKINNSTMRQIERDLQNNTEIYEALYPPVFNFQFYPEVIEKATKNKIFRDLYPKHFGYLVLYSYISWSIFIMQTRNSEYLFELLKALHILYTMKTNYSGQFDLRLLATSSFYHCYKLLFNYADDSKYEEYIYLLQEFFLYLDQSIQPEAYNILANPILKIFNSKSETINGQAAQFLSFLTHICSIIKERFPKKIIDLIQTQIILSLYSLDFHALKFFEVSINYTSENVVDLFLQPMVRAIIDFVSPETVFINLKNDIYEYKPNEQSNEYEESESSIYSSQMQKSLYFLTKDYPLPDSSYLIKVKKTIEQRTDMLNVFAQSFQQKLDLLCQALCYCQKYAIKFLNLYSNELFENQEKPITGAQYITFLYICTKLSSLQNITLPSHYIYNSFVFSPNITCFNPSEDFNNYNILRQHAIEVLFKLCQGRLKSVIDSASKYPLLYGEILLRLLTIPLEMDRRNIPKFIEGLFNAYSQYRIINNLQDNEIKERAIARKTLVFFLNGFLNNTKMKTFFFNTKECSKYFYILFLQESTEVDASLLLNSFLSPTVIVSAGFVSATSNFINALFTFKISSQEQVQEINFDWLHILNGIISEINAVMSVSIAVAHAFASMTESLCNNLGKLPNTKGAEDVLMSVVSFLAYSSPGHSIQLKELVAIEAAIDRLTNNNPTNGIKEKLIHIIAGRPLQFISPQFEIKQPKVLCILVRVFIKQKEKLMDIMSFLTNLFLFSPNNFTKCIEGEFDLFLIDIIDEWRTSGCPGGDEVFDKFLELLTLITTTKTSAIVVQRIIGFLSLVDATFIPYYHKNIINAINKMLTASMIIPSGSLPLDCKSSISISNLTPSMFCGTFSISFWMYYIETITETSKEANKEFKEKQNILKIWDNDQNFINIVLFPTKIGIRLSSNKKELKVNFNLHPKIKPRQWSLVTITFTPTEDKSNTLKCSLYIDHQLYNETSKFPKINFKKNSQISALYNSSSDKYKENHMKTRISSFSLTKASITPNNMKLIEKQGPRSMFLNQDVIFNCSVQQGNTRLILKTINGNGYHVNCETSAKHATQEHIFGNILIDNCNVENVIPLFAQVDYKDKDDKETEFLEEKAVSVLANVLNLGEFAQFSFYDISGFKAISHLLIASGSKHLTYQLYLRFYGLLSSISNEDLIKELFSSILLNIDILICSTPETNVKVLKHWYKTLFVKYEKYCFEIHSFSWFSSILGLYYYFTASDNDNVIKDRFDNNDYTKHDISDCRKVIADIMTYYLVSETRFKENEFISFLGEILNYEDSDQITSLVSFLIQIINQPDIIQHARNVLLSYSNNLLQLFSIQNESINIILLQFYISLYTSPFMQKCTCAQQSLNITSTTQSENKSPKSQFHIFVFQMMSKMNKTHASESMLKFLVNYIHSQNVNELLPMAIWVSMILGNEYLEQFYQNLPVNDPVRNNYYFSDLSLIYPVLSTFIGTDAVSVRIIIFIVNAFKAHWNKIPHLIRVFQRALNMNTEGQNIQSHFLKEIIHYLMSNTKEQTKDRLINILNMCFEFVFFRPKPAPGTCFFFNYTLNQLFSNSPYCEFSNSPNAITRIKLCEKPENLYKMLDTYDQSLYFGIRLDEKRNWEDQALVSELIYILTPAFGSLFKMESKSNSMDAILMIGFLLEVDVPIVEDFFKRNNDASKFGKEGLSFINSKMLKNNISSEDIPMIDAPKSEVAGMSFHFLETEAAKVDKWSSDEVKFSLALSKELEDLFTQCQNTTNISQSQSIESVTNMSKETKQENEKIWINMWRSMTLDRAPWNSSLPVASRKIRFKRDNCYCGIFCPIKFRRNFNFKDHMDASLFRESGSEEMVINELSKRYQKSHERRSSVIDLPELQNSTDEIVDSFLLSTRGSTQSQTDLVNKPQKSRRKTVEMDTDKTLLNEKNKIIFTEKCTLEKINRTAECIFTLYPNKIIIDKNPDKKPNNGITKTIFIPRESIQHIFARYFRQLPKGLEIVTKTGYSYLLFFEHKAHSILQLIIKTFHFTTSLTNIFMQTTDFRHFFEAHTKYTQQWLNYEITNFEYLLRLNYLSNRTFNSSSMYPVFPWIINDYTSEKIDLKNPKIYRDLSLPVGKLNEDRFKDLLAKYQELVMMEMPPYLYQSGYSYPLMVYLFLIRIEPFATLHIEYQSGRFDNPGRIFYAMDGTWVLVYNQFGDYRELIPEFFSSPEFLLNKNEYDLGKTERGVIGDVILPPWAQDAYEFVYINRKALESDIVSQSIHNWIDLIWGYKQRGEESVKAFNVFKEEMYPDIWDKQEQPIDEGTRINIEMNLDQIGQIPQQLFTEPHPQRSKYSPHNRFGMPKVFQCHFSNVVAASIQPQKDHLQFILINNFCKYAQYNIDLNLLLDPKEQDPLANLKENEGKALEDFSKLLFISPDYIVTLGNESTQICITNIHTMVRKVIKSHTEILCCAVEGEWAVVSGNDAALTIMRKNDKANHMVVRTYRNIISCIALSEKFDQVIAGTKDNTLIFCSLSRGAITYIHELGKDVTPLRILITKTLGFVLVDALKTVNGEMHHLLLLFNINGNLMRQLDIDYEITCWATWSNRKTGLDYIVVADSNGNLKFTETFYIDNGLLLCYETGQAIVGIDYNNDEQICVAISEKGTIFFIPFG